MASGSLNIKYIMISAIWIWLGKTEKICFFLLFIVEITHRLERFWQLKRGNEKMRSIK